MRRLTAAELDAYDVLPRALAMRARIQRVPFLAPGSNGWDALASGLPEASTTRSRAGLPGAIAKSCGGRSAWRLTGSRSAAQRGADLRYDLEIVPLREKDNFLFSDQSKYPIDKNNVSPRMGASYALDQAATAVVRGGWGLYYQKTAYSNFSNLVSAGAIALAPSNPN